MTTPQERTLALVQLTAFDVRAVDGEVLEVLADLGLAHVRTTDGSTFGLNRETPGLRFEELREGQRVRVQVAAKFGRVLHAELAVQHAVV